MITLREVIERNEALYPDAIHSIFEGKQTTFRQFALRARKLADGLYRLGLRHQDRFAVLSMNRTEFVEAYGAAELSGIILATVNWRLAAPEIAYIIKDSAPKALVFERQYVPLVESIRAELRGIEHFICLSDETGSDIPSWAVAYEDVVKSGADSGAPIRAKDSDVLALIYTSGTTGRPKGCMLSHAGNAFMGDQSAAYQSMLPGDRALVIAPLFHIGARSQQLPMNMRGGCVVILRAFNAEAILQTIAKERITHVHIVPTMMQGVLDIPDNERYDTSSLKCIIYSAAPMPLPVLKRAMKRFGPVMLNGWGLTEGGNGSAFPRHLHRPDGTPDEIKRLGSVGQATANTDVRVGDEEDREVPRGTVGELLLRSASNLLGYWNNGPATMETLRNGWLHTGDMGYMDEQGYIFLVDRKKDMIISGGENIYCREVEEALIDHKGLADVAVIGVPDEKWGETVKAYAVRARGSNVTADELVAHCKTLIASYKCPKQIDFIDELPRLPSGKVSKVILRERHAASAAKA